MPQIPLFHLVVFSFRICVSRLLAQPQLSGLYIVGFEGSEFMVRISIDGPLWTKYHRGVGVELNQMVMSIGAGNPQNLLYNIESI